MVTSRRGGFVVFHRREIGDAPGLKGGPWFYTSRQTTEPYFSTGFPSEAEALDAVDRLEAGAEAVVVQGPWIDAESSALLRELAAHMHLPSPDVLRRALRQLARIERLRG
jgi:hypothetical protein